MGGFRPVNSGNTPLGRKQKELKSLLGQIEKDETISDITRGELSAEGSRLSGLSGTDFAGAGGFKFLKDVDQVSATLRQAREGKGKFAGRQIQSKQRSLLADRPGRAQTILTR